MKITKEVYVRTFLCISASLNKNDIYKHNSNFFFKVLFLLKAFIILIEYVTPTKKKRLSTL